jgi:thiol-disulfide isomerase/thioredoxin
MKTIILVVYFLVISNQIFAQDFEPTQVYTKAISLRKTNGKLTAEIAFKVQNIGDNIPTEMEYKIIRTSNDSFFMRIKPIKGETESYVFQNKDSAFTTELNSEKKTYIQINKKTKTGLQKSVVVFRTLGLNWQDWDSSSFINTMKDTIIYGLPCWKLRQHPKSTPFSIILESSLFISKSDFIIRGYSLTEIFNTLDTVYQSSFLKKINFEESSINNDIGNFKSEIEFVRLNYKQLFFENQIEEPNNTNLKIGKIRLLNIEKKDSMEINLEKGKFILDFWYIGCRPCLTGMPYLDSLDILFHNKFVKFLKINSIDFNNFSRVRTYCKKHSIEKNNFLDCKNLDSKLGITAYPSYILIEDGVIIKKFEGFDETVYEELKKYLEIWTADSR